MMRHLRKWFRDEQGSEMVAWAVSFPLLIILGLAVWQFLIGLWTLSQVQSVTSVAAQTIVQEGCWTPSLDTTIANDARSLGLNPQNMWIQVAVNNGVSGSPLSNTSQAAFGDSLIVTINDNYTFRFLGGAVFTVDLNDSDGGLSQAIATNQQSQQYAAECSLPSTAVWGGQT